jgi:3-hydroxyacyl-CoA dehydrogenase
MIIQCVETGVNTDDFDAGLQFEFASFDQCFEHPQREALIHVFFSEREVAKIPDVPKDTPVKTIEQAGIIGCGTMGGGIAMCFANVGIPVKVVEMDREAMERGLGVIRNNYQIQAQRGRMTEADVDERMNLITGISDYSDLKDVDIVIEAIYENIDVKKEVFENLDKVIKPGAVLASNTSGLDIDAIAAATSRPEEVIGTHFFSPANIMRLLEVVRGENTNAETIATAMKLGKRLGKVAVLSGNAPWFIGNRMLGKYSDQGRGNSGARRLAVPGRRDHAGVRHADGAVSDGRSDRPGPGVANAQAGWQGAGEFSRALQRCPVRDGPLRTEDIAGVLHLPGGQS